MMLKLAKSGDSVWPDGFSPPSDGTRPDCGTASFFLHSGVDTYCYSFN